MRWKQRIRSGLVGTLLAGLAATGLTPGVAQAAAEDPNLALGKPASASGSHPGYPAPNITDGSQQTYWEGPAGEFPRWVQTDLGSTATVDEVVLKLPTTWEARTQTLSIQGSTDGDTFTTLSAAAAHEFRPDRSGSVTIGFPAAKARYIRVNITKNTGWNAAQLSELEVRGEGGGPGDPPLEGTNLARGKPIEASSHTQNYVAAGANDDDVKTYWEAAGQSASLTVKLGASASLEGVVVKLNPDPAWSARTQEFTVLGRESSGAEFKTIKARQSYAFSPSSNQNTVSVPVSGVYEDVRLQFHANSGAPGGQVAELQVIGAAAPAPDLTVTTLDWTPEKPSAEDEITVKATVRNSGNAASQATAMEASLGGTVAGSASVPALAAGATADVEVRVGKRPAGSYTVSAVADPNDTIDESDDTNNSRTADAKLVVERSPGPDLEPTGITTSPEHPATGTKVTFKVSVRNNGTSQAAAGTVTRLTVNGSALQGTAPAVPAGGSATVDITGDWTATSGGATLTANADATGALAETDETNNVFTRSVVIGRGAAVPYTEYEAEDGDYKGTLLKADAKREFGHTNFDTESSGRSSVRLNQTGEYVEFTSKASANSIVVRNSIPDAPGGGGQDATISLYADGKFVRKLDLSSKHSWLYGTTDDPEGLTNRPGGDARRLFDESHALLAQSYPAGTKFRLQRDSGDTAAFYVLDLVDLEQVAPAAAKPDGCTSITEYGAVPNDGIDDTDAIQRAVTADQNGDIGCVWIPAGQWRQERKILTQDPKYPANPYNQVGIRNVTVKGAGMWHSQLYTLTEPQNAGTINHPHEGNFGFDIDDNTQISDIAIFGSGRIRGGDGNAEGGVGLSGRFGKDTKIKNVWIEHANVGAWVGRDYGNIPALWGPGENLEFSGMRIRNTYADGVNFTNGTHHSTVYNSSFRNTGDDALAVWASKHVKDTSTDIGRNNSFKNNTVQLPWRANGIAIYGGKDNSIENNLISDTMTYPGIMLATDHDPVPFSGQTLISGNGLYRTGGAFWGEAQEFGAITLFPQGPDIPGVTIKDTEIHDSTYDGIQFKNGGGAVPGAKIENVRIDKCNNGGAGILAMGGARGSATLSNVDITNCEDADGVVVEPGSGFVINRS
ncbi:APHP domain-containing protein [Streptomyces sp. A7024]|uniref:APHP domain-containing protein n=1 Tax=Streptomyces coryli TaxID=1128680 RepID=A0A6G4TX07_9ACTN|nr:CARDB domain-containing protein [Streptomyces coryli]NGN63648.1 APHP domain-containing protein [Streptomyces coryli]